MLNCFIRMLRFSVVDPNNKSAAEMYAEIDSLTNQDFQQIDPGRVPTEHQSRHLGCGQCHAKGWFN